MAELIDKWCDCKICSPQLRLDAECSLAISRDIAGLWGLDDIPSSTSSTHRNRVPLTMDRPTRSTSEPPQTLAVRENGPEFHGNFWNDDLNSYQGCGWPDLEIRHPWQAPGCNERYSTHMRDEVELFLSQARFKVEDEEREKAFLAEVKRLKKAHDRRTRGINGHRYYPFARRLWVMLAGLLSYIC